MMEPWRTSLLIAGSTIAGSSMVMKTVFLYVHMWQRGTRDKTVMRFLAFELMVVVFWWFFYENEAMSRCAVIFQRVVTIGQYLGWVMVLIALWKEIF